MFHFNFIIKAAKASDGKKSLDELLSTQKVCINEIGFGTTPAGYLATQGNIESVKALISRGAIILPIVQGLAYAPKLSGEKYLRNLKFSKALCKKYDIPSAFLIKSIAEGGHDDCLSPEEKKDDNYEKWKALGKLRKLFSSFSPDNLPEMVNLADKTMGITSTYQVTQEITHDSMTHLLNIAMRYEEDDISDYLLEKNFITCNNLLASAIKEKNFYQTELIFSLIEDSSEYSQAYKLEIIRALIVMSFSQGHWEMIETLYNKYKADLYPLEQLSRVAFERGNLEIVKYFYENFSILPNCDKDNPDFKHDIQLTYPNNKSFFHLIIHINDKKLLDHLINNYCKLKALNKFNIEEIARKAEASFLIHFSTNLAIIKHAPFYDFFKTIWRELSDCRSQIGLIEQLKVQYDLNNKMLFSWADPTIQWAVLQGIQLVFRGTISFDLYGYMLTYLTPITSQQSYSLLNKMYYQQNRVLIGHSLENKMQQTPFYKMRNDEYIYCYHTLKNIKESKNIDDLHQVISSTLEKSKSSEEKIPEFKKIILHCHEERLGNKYKRQSIFNPKRKFDEISNSHSPSISVKIS